MQHNILKIKQSLSGENNPFFGKKHTTESKLKMRNSHLGKKQSKEHIIKRSEICRGKKRNQETKDKISKANNKNLLIEKECNYCKNIFKTYESKHSKFCSKVCLDLYREQIKCIRFNDKIKFNDGINKYLHFIQKVSNNTIRLISEGVLKIPKRKSYIVSKKTKEKMSVSHQARKKRLGYINSPEARIKIGNAKRGTKASEESRKKMSDSHHGKRQPCPEKTKIKIGLANSGDNNGQWKGGITPENKKIRVSLKYKTWRNSVFNRDNYVCRKCNITKDNTLLRAHHILNFSEYPELRFDINNGITFCENCHNKFHKKYGTRNNNQEQIDEFLSIPTPIFQLILNREYANV